MPKGTDTQQPLARPRKAFTKAERQLVWEKRNKGMYYGKCFVTGCPTCINVWDFEVAHNIPHSMGGSDEIKNLEPLCRACNNSMRDTYTIDEWANKLGPGARDPTTVISKARQGQANHVPEPEVKKKKPKNKESYEVKQVKPDHEQVVAKNKKPKNKKPSTERVKETETNKKPKNKAKGSVEP